MTVKEILNGQIGQKATGFTVSVKTLKKQWQVSGVWYQQAVLMDDTGEILADVKLGKAAMPNTRPTLHRQDIKVISCELQESEFMNKPCKKLYIDKYSEPTQTVAEYEAKEDALIEDYTKTIRSKILCWLVAAKIEAGAHNGEVLSFLEDPRTKQIVDKILEG